MKTLSLFTDPHLGTARKAHTTRESSERLGKALYEQARLCSRFNDAVCLGDLFDRSNNPEHVLVQGMEVARNCAAVLAGNHDETNREGTVSSLRALEAAGFNVIAATNLSTPYFCHLGYAGYPEVVVVPHHASQELFEQALDKAADYASALKGTVLLLHCNYDFGFRCEDDTLNLSAAKAEELLKTFSMILLGHEHQPAEHFDGRLVILGNTHPTSFADISDKYRYKLDFGDGYMRLKRELIWSEAKGYRVVQYGDHAAVADLDGVEFVDVVGGVGADEAVALSEFIQSIWDQHGSSLYAVRNNVVVGEAIGELASTDEPAAAVDMRSAIQADLAGTDLADLFNELCGELK